MNYELLLWGLLGVVLHELAHALMAVSLGLRVKGVVICAKGIGVRREPGTQRQNAAIALAGPLVNLTLCVLLWAHPAAVAANAVLCIVNLLPIAGSDGLRVIQSLRG